MPPARRSMRRTARRTSRRTAKRQDAMRSASAPAPAEYAEPAPAAPAPAAEPDKFEQLKELGALHEQGILTDEEFAAEKAKLL